MAAPRALSSEASGTSTGMPSASAIICVHTGELVSPPESRAPRKLRPSAVSRPTWNTEENTTPS